MFSTQRTNSLHIIFKELIVLLDKFLEKRDGEEHLFYDQFNKLDDIKNAVICFDSKEAIGCGSFKKYDNKTVEIKRMFVKPNHRGKGAATLVLKELEKWAKENNYFSAVLETVKDLPEGIAIYIKNGYTLIPNFGQYKNIEKSVCIHKNL